jgi:nuclear receptor coactivator 2
MLMLQISVDLQQYKQHYMLQQQQKRLLQAQQQQQLVISSSATTVVEPLAPGLQNIDSLLNNTVAPNVSLQVQKSPEMLVLLFKCALKF